MLAGQCAAINVGHWDPRAIRRGDTLAVPGYFSPGEWYVCKLRLLPREKLHLQERRRGEVPHRHLGGRRRGLLLLGGESLRAAGDYLIQVRDEDARRGRARRPFHPPDALAGADRRRRHDRRGRPRQAQAEPPGVLEDLQERAGAVADEARFVEYCVRRAESLAVGEAELASRAKVLRGRLQEILADLVRQQKVIGLAPGSTCTATRRPRRPGGSWRSSASSIASRRRARA